MIDIVHFLSAHSSEIWAQVLFAIAGLGAFLKGVEAILDLIAPFTPWKWDNDLAALIGKLLANKIFKKKV